MPNTIEDLLVLADDSIRFPHSAMTIARVAQRADTTNRDIADQIEQDPAFTAQLLRIVNSASYSPITPIASVDEAISRVGREAIVELAWVQSSANAFNHLESESLRARTFWKHSRASAVLASQLAAEIGEAQGDAFVAGLLHDIGLLLLFHTQPKTMEQVLDHSLDQHTELATSERLAFGYDHAEVGAALADHWQLPDVLVCAIEHHHEPRKSPRHKELVACVALANQLADEASPDEGIVQASEGMLAQLGDPKQIEQVVMESAKKAERYTAVEV